MNNLNKNKTIQCYHVIQVIGKGANGLVYKGINVNNGSFVAMKEMHLGKVEIKTIRAEISFLKQLDHPNIVKYIDAVVKDHCIYLILEYIEGGSLSSLCKRSVFPETLIRLYIYQILQGLQYLHSMGIVHRDVKGANVLLTKQGKIKIADFGVAININDVQRTLSAAGTPYWMAPESINGSSEISIKCDIWSLGCTLIQLLTGNPPYHELASFPALIRIVQDQHPPLPIKASKDCLDFLIRCFSKNPKERCTSAELLEHKWIQSILSFQINSSKHHGSIKNSNLLEVQEILKNKNLQEIFKFISKTQNKKLIYLNNYILKLSEIENCDLKLECIQLISSSSYSALKYIEQIGIIKNLLTKECKTLKINPMKMLDFVSESYRRGYEEDQCQLLQNNGLKYVCCLLQDQWSNKKQIFVSNVVTIQRALEILKKILFDELIVAYHVFLAMQEQNTMEVISNIYAMSCECKTSQLSIQCLLILNKYLDNFHQQQDVDAIISPHFKNMSNFIQHSNQIDLSLTNLNILSIIIRYNEFAEKLQSFGLVNNLSQFIKLIVLNKNICDEHFQLIERVIIFLIQFILPKNQRIKSFIKAAGVKRLRSLPLSVMKVSAISEKLQQFLAAVQISQG